MDHRLKDMNNFVKYIANFLLIACMALLSFGANAQNFEGEINLTTTNPAIQEEAVVRWITSNGNHKLIMNGTANGKSFSYTMLMLKNDASVRILTDINGVKSMFVTPVSDVKPVNPTLGSAIVTAGDGTTTIAGQSCKKYSIESSQGSATVFVSNTLSLNLNDLPTLLKSNGIFATLAANNINGLPFSIISRGEDGKVAFSQTVTAITPGSVSASEFSFEGYGDGGAALQNSMKQN
jgi:hypothetical protein